MNEETALAIMRGAFESQMHGDDQPTIEFMTLRRDQQGQVYAHMKVSQRLARPRRGGHNGTTVEPTVNHYKVYEGHQPQKVLLSDIQQDQEV